MRSLEMVLVGYRYLGYHCLGYQEVLPTFRDSPVALSLLELLTGVLVHACLASRFMGQSQGDTCESTCQHPTTRADRSTRNPRCPKYRVLGPISREFLSLNYVAVDSLVQGRIYIIYMHFLLPGCLTLEHTTHQTDADQCADRPVHQQSFRPPAKEEATIVASASLLIK